MCSFLDRDYPKEAKRLGLTDDDRCLKQNSLPPINEKRKRTRYCKARFPKLADGKQSTAVFFNPLLTSWYSNRSHMPRQWY